MKYSCVFLCYLLSVMGVPKTLAQPYLDLINARFTNSPEGGIFNRNKEKIKLNYVNISTTLPILFKNKKDAIILSPFFEKWNFTTNNKQENYFGFILPVSFLKQVSSNWGILLTGILRKNDYYTGINMKNQLGGAFIASYKKRQNLTYKFGVYLNDEYFGLFIMPLLGIDWRINDKNCIFGVLPGNITYQHLISRTFAYGIAFRAQTNSYNRLNGNYIRIDENQLGAFADIYLSKNIVLNAELGHSFFRQIRSERLASCVGGDCNLKYHDYKVNDNMYFKVSAAYRISL